jgi:hypothetical protein
MGGSDEPSNLIELTVEEHAEAHRKLWEKHGHWQDKIAWQGLSKMVNKIELISQMQSQALKEYHSKKEVKEKYKKLNEERWQNKEHRDYISSCTKKQWENIEFKKMHSDLMKELNKQMWSDENYVKKMTESNRNNNRKVISLNDGKITSWSSRTKHEKKTGFKHEWKNL